MNMDTSINTDTSIVTDTSLSTDASLNTGMTWPHLITGGAACYRRACSALLNVIRMECFFGYHWYTQNIT